MQAFAETIIYLILGAVATIYKGWAISILWKWFLVPLGLNPISIVLAIGVGLIISFLTYQYDFVSHNKEPREILVEATVGSYVLTTIFLVLGFVVSLFL